MRMASGFGGSWERSEIDMDDELAKSMKPAPAAHEVDYFPIVVNIMEANGNLGVRVLPNGTRLIGHVPHVAPEAWLHLLFPPLSAAQVQNIERDIGNSLPNVFSAFLLKANGLSLFSGSLSIDGLRFSHERSGDAVWQPFSIITPNVTERPRSSKASFVFIGGYRCDGSLLYIDKATSNVFRCKSKSAKAINEWPSFGAMLVAETQRLSVLFDAAGRKIDPKRPTTP
jgi:hypothetical protein